MELGVHRGWGGGDLKEKGDRGNLRDLTVSSIVMCSNTSRLESYLLTSKGIPPFLQECLNHLPASAKGSSMNSLARVKSSEEFFKGREEEEESSSFHLNFNPCENT